MLLEVIATNLDDALVAEDNGADRIELVSNILEGGLTPSVNLIEEIARHIQIPVNIMVRPHSYSYQYSFSDVEQMSKDIEMIQDNNANGIVLGLLTRNNKIDLSNLNSLISHIGSLNVTFHRAFDEIEQQERGLDILAQFSQVQSILTSGRRKNALQSIEQFKRLVKYTEGSHFAIMAGGGLTIHALKSFIDQTGVSEVHFGKGVRFDNDPFKPIDPDKVKKIKQIIKETENLT